MGGGLIFLRAEKASHGAQSAARRTEERGDASRTESQRKNDGGEEAIAGHKHDGKRRIGRQTAAINPPPTPVSLLICPSPSPFLRRLAHPPPRRARKRLGVFCLFLFFAFL